MTKKIIEVSFLFWVTLSVMMLTAQIGLAGGDTYTVNTTSDTGSAQACIDHTAGCTFRNAILTANAARGGGATIRFSIPASDPGCSAGVCTIKYTSNLPALTGPNTIITGPGASRLTIQPGPGPAKQGLTVQTDQMTTTSISGITITGAAEGSRGGIHKLGIGTLNLIEIILHNNHAVTGAALRVVEGIVRMERSLLRNNTADAGGGGGIAIDSGASCVVTNTTIVANISFTTGGGGIFSRGLVASSYGTVYANSALHGIPGNQSNGGGVYSLGPSPDVMSSIIAGNFADDSGPDVSGTFLSHGFNLVGKRDGSTGFNSPTDLTGVIAAPLDPKLDPLGYQDNGGPTPTVALMANSPAIDKGAAPQGTVVTDQRGAGFRRERDNPLVPNTQQGRAVDIGAYERHTSTIFDFDGDGRTEVGIFRPSVAEWWIYQGLIGSTFAAQFGAPGDRAVPADYTGDGKTDIAFWRPATGQWFIVRSENGTYFAAPFGASTDIPVPADYDADGKADVAVFRPSTGFWFIQRSSNSQVISQLFGQNGDQPIPSDYDRDGRADVAIFRPSAGEWWLNRTTAGTIAYSFGSGADKVVPGDYTGDGRTDVAFWRPATGEWFVVRSENGTYFSAPFGASTDLPTPGDFDGDGKYDFTVFRPSNGTWFINRTLGGTSAQQFGANGDLPLPRAFLP